MAKIDYDYIVEVAASDDRSFLLSHDGVHGVAVMADRRPELWNHVKGILGDWELLDDLDQRVREHILDVRATKKRQRKEDRVSGDDGLTRDGNGTVIVNAENIAAAVKALGIRLSYDEFRATPTIKRLKGHGPALDDHALRRLYILMETDFGFRPSRQFFEDVVLDIAYQNRFNPVADYLDWEIAWDGKPRLDTWLRDYAGAKDTAYVRAVSAMVLIAAVRRIRSPGAKFDEMLILESEEQGLGKSSLIAALAVRPEWFTDSLPLNAPDKIIMESMAGKWIAEVAELAGMKKGEVERIRSQLSRQSDRARMAYGRLTEERQRSFIMIGTTNASANAPYLADIDGNRRFWPIEVGHCDVAGFIAMRDQIWAEAAAREEAGESIRLPEELWQAAGREQHARAIGNAFTDRLAPMLGRKEGIIRSDDAWNLLGIPLAQRDSNAGKFGKAMSGLGWKRQQRRLKRGADREPCYVKGTSGRLLVVERDNDLGRGGVLLKYADRYLAPSTGDYDL